MKQGKSNKLLPRECTGHSKNPLPTTQEKTLHMDIIRLIIFFAAKDGEALYCGSDHELLITKFRLKLKEVGKTTSPFRYNLNQILYNYTVEERNRFKGLDLIDTVPEELWFRS